MLILAATVTGLLLVPVLGGDLRRLADLRFATWWLAPYAASLAVLALFGANWPRPVVLGLHTSAYVLAGVFAWLNRSVPGLPLLAVGLGLTVFHLADASLRQVVPVGLALAALGAVWLVHRQCGSALTRRPDLTALAARVPRPRRTPPPPPRSRTVVVPDQYRPRNDTPTASQLSADARLSD